MISSVSSKQLVHTFNVNDKITYAKVLIVVAVVLLIASCGSQKAKDAPPVQAPYTFVDSTEYFADRTASVSMRATFHREQPASGMAEGYRFQFRTINTQPAFLNSISLVAGGKRIFLEEGQIVLPLEKGITLQLSLEDSLLVAQQNSALLQFRHNNTSHIFTIELHQLKPFTIK